MMNYKRIYDEFILDRKSKQDINGYYEIHHIVPKSFGGTNDESNLVKLTASEHLFAHALLARIYKGKMIYALHLMLNCQKNSTNRNDRLHYSFVKSNYKMSDETKKKLSDLNKGNRLSEKTKMKLSEMNKGEKCYWYNKKHSKQTINKISKSLQSKKKSISQYSLDGLFLKSFESLNEAAKSINKPKTNISSCCRNKTKSAYGFIWKYN